MRIDFSGLQSQELLDWFYPTPDIVGKFLALVPAVLAITMIGDMLGRLMNARRSRD